MIFNRDGNGKWYKIITSAIEVLSFIDCKLIGCENIEIFFLAELNFFFRLIVTINDEGWVPISW